MPSPLDITLKSLEALPEPARSQVKAMLNVKQALYDILGKYPQDNVLPYFYQAVNNSANGNQLSALGTGQNSIKISADSAFIACSIRGASVGDFTTLMRQDASDRQMMNQQIYSGALMGTAQRPGIFDKPLLLPANTTISFDYTDISGAANDIYLVLAGFKVYNRMVA